ncbi:hypothetical protein Dimus_015246 [Dionaea muscipula]
MATTLRGDSDRGRERGVLVSVAGVVHSPIDRGCPDTIIVLRHYQVFTLECWRFSQLCTTIIDLRNHEMDHHWYLGALEEVVISALSLMFSIEASRDSWVHWCTRLIDHLHSDSSHKVWESRQGATEAYFSRDHEVPGGMVMVKPRNDQEFAQDRRILEVGGAQHNLVAKKAVSRARDDDDEGIREGQGNTIVNGVAASNKGFPHCTLLLNDPLKTEAIHLNSGIAPSTRHG